MIRRSALSICLMFAIIAGCGAQPPSNARKAGSAFFVVTLDGTGGGRVTTNSDFIMYTAEKPRMLRKVFRARTPGAVLNVSELKPALQAAIIGMREGEKRRIWLPIEDGTYEIWEFHLLAVSRRT